MTARGINGVPPVPNREYNRRDPAPRLPGYALRRPSNSPVLRSIRRISARLSTELRVLGRRDYGPTRDRLSVFLCIGTLK
jgi:hypothetical protein